MGIDEFCDIDSPVHWWDPRFKFIGLVTLIFAFSFIQDLRILPAMVIVTAAIYAISSLPLSFLLRRLRYPSLFLLVIVLLLPFVSGQTIISSIGPLDIRMEGLISVVLIAIRFLSILTIGLVIFSTAPFFTTLKAMRALGFPSILTDIALLAFRYVYETGDDLRKMQASMKLRGFRNKIFSIRVLGTLAWLGGSILVRSYERSECVYKAMILRVYGNSTRTKDEFHACRRDIIALSITLMVAAGFIAWQIMYRQEITALLQ